MTVSTETNHNEYTGNDVTTSFPYTFRIFKKSDLVVFTSANDGDDIKILRVDTDYTVTSVGGFRGGNVVLKAPLAAGVQISISRELPATQETSLRNQGKFFPEVHEDAFDKLTMLIQQVRSSFSLALRKPSFLANYYDALGNYIRNLRDPSRPQDAATKNYVDNQIVGNTENWKNADKKSLRVSDVDLHVLPPAQERAEKVLTFDRNGQPQIVAPASGSAVDVLNQLANGDGSLVGVGNGETLKERLEMIFSPLTPEMFIKAGEINHTRAFTEMAAKAKEMRRPIFGEGTYIIDSTVEGIALEVPTDLSQATIKNSTVEDVGQWLQKTTIFSIPQEYEDITNIVTDTYHKGVSSLSIRGYAGLITFDSTELVMVRDDGGSLSNQMMREANEVFTDGSLKYLGYYDFDRSKTTVLHKPFRNSIEIKLPKFVLDASFIRSVLRVTRNNVTVIANEIATVNYGHCQGYIEQADCCEFKLSKATYNLNYSSANEGGYAFVYHTVCGTVLSDLIDPNGWAGVDGNYGRNISIDNSSVLTFGGHFSNSDLIAKNTTIYNHCSSHGFGEFQLIDCKHVLRGDKDNEFSLGTSVSYGCSWDGKMIVHNLQIYLSDKTRLHRIVSTPEPKSDKHNFMSTCPDIEVDGVTIYPTQGMASLSGVEFRGLDLGISSGVNNEKSQYLPRKHSIKNVTLAGTTFFNRIDFRAVYNQRNYSVMTAAEFVVIRRQNYVFTLLVEDIIAEKSGKSNSSGYFDVMSFDFPSSVNLTQEITIKNSGNCIPVVRAGNGIICRASGQRMNFGLVDARRDKTANSFNEIYYSDCVIYSPGVRGASTGRSAILYFNFCKYDWLEFSPFTSDETLTNHKVLGADIAASSGASIASMNGCFSRLSGSDRTVDTKFRGWVSNNYKDTGFII